MKYTTSSRFHPNQFVYLYLFWVIVFLNSCTLDELRPTRETSCDNIVTSYELNIRQIVDNTCAYSGCHPEYTDFQGILPVLDDGSFNSRVLRLAADPNLGMPPDYAPANRPKDLSEEQINLITCWLENDYPEN
ncbi:MAG: hypothetical protein AAFO07_28845 [Bacteroidota bacterium]